MSPALHWTWARFDKLGVHALHALRDALALRCRVFILEQGPHQDPDDADKHAWHLLGRRSNGTQQAVLRVVDPGVNYAEPSIGRVVAAPELRISAQAHLQGFYGEQGFTPVTAEYLEDGIAHIGMLWRPPQP